MIAIFIVLFMVLASIGLIFVSVKKNKSTKVFGLIGIVAISFVIAAFMSILFFVWAFGAFRDFAPVVKDDFYLHKTGTTKEYIITPRFKDWLAGANGDYEVFVYLERVPSSAVDKIEFHPIIKVSTLLNNTIIDSIIIDKSLNVIIDERYTKKVFLTKLPKVLWGLKNNSYTIRVEVLQGDGNLLPYADNFNTQIAVDNYP